MFIIVFELNWRKLIQSIFEKQFDRLYDYQECNLGSCEHISNFTSMELRVGVIFEFIYKIFRKLMHILKIYQQKNHEILNNH